MPLSLQNLDDRTYADLVEEARSRIAALDPAWTNHNPSDPGITLLELLAWRTEMLVYRTNQVPPDHVLAFLRLLKGPDWTPPENDAEGGAALADTSRAAVLELRERFRAVTAEDYEYLATTAFDEWRRELERAEGQGALRPCRLAADYAEAAARAALGQNVALGPQDGACPWCLDGGDCPTLAADAALADWWALTGLAPRGANLPSRMPVARARCVPGRDLEQRRISRRSRALPDHVSLVVVPAADAGMAARPAPDEVAAAKAKALTGALWTWLDERRTLTTHHHVLSPRYVPLALRALVVLSRDVPNAADARRAAGVRSTAAALTDADLQAVHREWVHLADPDPRQPLRAVLERYFDPVSGGRDGTGWPFGRGVYLSELYELLERQDSVEYVATVQVLSSDTGARLLWNHDGEAYGLALGSETADPHGAGLQLLPRLRVAVEDVVVCEGTVPVEVVVELPAAPGGMTQETLDEVRGAMQLAVRGAFPPFGAPGGAVPPIPADTAPEAAALLQRGMTAIFCPLEESIPARAVGTADVLAALAGAPTGYRPSSVTLRAEGERLAPDGRGGQVVRFRAGEVAEVRVTLRAAGGTP
jgi:hypothetical protein